jgi:hypothetical protein
MACGRHQVTRARQHEAYTLVHIQENAITSHQTHMNERTQTHAHTRTHTRTHSPSHTRPISRTHTRARTGPRSPRVRHAAAGRVQEPRVPLPEHEQPDHVDHEAQHAQVHVALGIDGHRLQHAVARLDNQEEANLPATSGRVAGV